MNPSAIWKHYAAFLYDLFPILGILLLTGFVTLLFRNGAEVPAGTLWFNLLTAFEILIYYVYSWKVGGQTLGMRAWKLKIVNEQNIIGLNWSQATIRFFVGIISTMTLGLGVIWKKFSKENKSWMDISSQSKTVSYEKS